MKLNSINNAGVVSKLENWGCFFLIYLFLFSSNINKITKKEKEKHYISNNNTNIHTNFNMSQDSEGILSLSVNLF